MKKMSIILFVCLSVISCAQVNQVKEIHIFHTYEDLYVSYIAPSACNDSQEHGPIIITDSLKISEICKLLNKIEKCDVSQNPDVRFKVEFLSDKKMNTLCFGQPNERMIYSNNSYKYNTALCSYLINIVEKSGAEKPQKVLPPK